MSVKVRWKKPVGRRTITKCRFPGNDACKQTETTFNLGTRQVQQWLSHALKRGEIVQALGYSSECPDSLFLFRKEQGESVSGLEHRDVTAGGLSFGRGRSLAVHLGGQITLNFNTIYYSIKVQYI